MRKKRIILFGTGKNYETFKKYFANVHIVALLDNDGSKQGRFLDGHEVTAPAAVPFLVYDAIFCLGIHWQEMKKQLLSLGVPGDKIYCQDDIREVLGNETATFPLRTYFPGSCENAKRTCNKKRVVLLSHDLSYTGATIVLLYFADVLLARGYQVTFSSAEGGNLIKNLQQRKIPVVIDENLRVRYIEEIDWLKAYDLIVVNTIEFMHFLLHHDINVPIFWWLHDSEMLYHMRNMVKLKQINLEGIYVYAVGNVAQRAFQYYWPEADVKILPYGLPDFYAAKSADEPSERIVFSLVGGLVERKGQDVFLEAIAHLPDDYRKKCMFYIAGDGQGGFARKIKEQAASLEGVRYLGKLNREEIKKLYAVSSVLVCPSRSDTLPVVVAEAFMNYVPVIVSVSTGMAQYIHQGDNGILVRTDSSEDLAKKIIWMIDHKERFAEMGKRARKRYERYFSMDVFSHRVSKILGDMGI